MLKMSDIAARAGVSPTTVSFVLNERPEAERISPKTREKVLQAAEEMGYRSNQWARAMRTGNTKMLGILGGQTALEQVGLMLKGALEAADEHNYTLKILLADSIGNTAQQIIRRSSELRLMGILALHLPETFLDELNLEAQKYGTPIVLMDSSSENELLTRVLSDDQSGISAGVDHLVNLGHSKIAFISGQPGVMSVRKKAFRIATASHGLSIPDEYIVDGNYTCRTQSYEAARSLLSLPADHRPTALFCAGDSIALAAIQAASDLKIAVPHDVSIMGFSNLKVAEYANPPLTSIEQNFEEVGRTATNVLLEMIKATAPSEPSANGGNGVIAPVQQTAPGQIHHLPVSLVERSSTAPPP